jgi:heme O synthase-like polyprenyltransferase
MAEKTREPFQADGRAFVRSVTYIIRADRAIVRTRWRPRSRWRMHPFETVQVGWIAILVATTTVMFLFWMFMVLQIPGQKPG